jgi:hypothetical protein
MVSISFYFLLTWTENERNISLLLSGLFLSLAVLTNYSSAILYPSFLGYILISQKNNRIKNGLFFILPTLLIFVWLYTVFFIYHMKPQQLVDKPDSFALHHFPFLQYVSQRPFYFYFLNIFLVNPLYLFFFMMCNSNIRHTILQKYRKLFLFLLSAIFSIFIAVTYFGITGSTFQMRYILFATPFLIVLLSIIPFEKIRLAWILFWIFVLCNFTLTYYNFSIHNAEFYNGIELVNFLR